MHVQMNNNDDDDDDDDNLSWNDKIHVSCSAKWMESFNLIKVISAFHLKHQHNEHVTCKIPPVHYHPIREWKHANSTYTYTGILTVFINENFNFTKLATEFLYLNEQLQQNCSMFTLMAVFIAKTMVSVFLFFFFCATLFPVN